MKTRGGMNTFTMRKYF